MDADWLLQRLLIFIPLLLSLTVHEWAHAWSAYRLGDDTASMQGRLTLNPLAHIDPFGTLILPLLGVPFGWAKPVPVNPARFRRDVKMSTGMMITAAAGPLSNVLIALLCTVGMGLAIRFGLLANGFGDALTRLLVIGIQINISLALFNLLPIPPLDGSRVVDGLIPYSWRGAWEQVTQYSSIILLVVVIFASQILAGPMAFMNSLIQRLMFSVAGVG